MGLNLSNRQIAQELELNKDDIQQMTADLRQMIYARRNPALLSGEVEFDEVIWWPATKDIPPLCVN